MNLSPAISFRAHLTPTHLPRTLRLAAMASLFSLALVASAATSCDPHSYGAKADGATKDTAAIQKAIDTCSAQGGGTVTLAAGTYLSAPIVLKSNVTLHLDKGATLLGSPDHADYPARTEFHAPGLQSLLSAHGATNIAITGEGTVDGNGATWWAMARAIKDTGILGSDHPRPRLVVLEHCKHVLLEGVTFQNSPMWQIVPYDSDDVTIRNIRVLALDGRLVLIAFLQGSKLENFDLTPIMTRRLTVCGSTMRPRTTAQKGSIATALRERVWPVLAAGRCGPVIHRTFKLAEAGAAHALMESSAHIGKIMLDVGL